MLQSCIPETKQLIANNWPVIDNNFLRPSRGQVDRADRLQEHNQPILSTNSYAERPPLRPSRSSSQKQLALPTIGNSTFEPNFAILAPHFTSGPLHRRLHLADGSRDAILSDSFLPRPTVTRPNFLLTQHLLTQQRDATTQLTFFLNQPASTLRLQLCVVFKLPVLPSRPRGQLRLATNNSNFPALRRLADTGLAWAD
jgi:hypothetical protein